MSSIPRLPHTFNQLLLDPGNLEAKMDTWPNGEVCLSAAHTYPTCFLRSRLARSMGRAWVWMKRLRGGGLAAHQRVVPVIHKEPEAKRGDVGDLTEPG